MTELIIRLARPGEAHELARLRYTLRSRNRQPADADTRQDIESESDFLLRCSKWMTHALQQTSWRCWVAERDGGLVGALWLQLIEKIPNPAAESESFAYITNFFVKEKDRGEGIGSAVLREALKWCEQQEVHGVILWPTEKSRSLYQRHSFDVTTNLFELVLTPKE
ncbi:MAG TPA: GNAT family N-acetyltransferase [Pyrinomonadaceae bacterium]